MTIVEFASGVIVGFTVTTAVGLGLLCAVGAWRGRGSSN